MSELNSANSVTPETPDTPSALWRVNKEKDPHEYYVNKRRIDLCMGNITDDELANEVYLNGDRKLTHQELLSGKVHPPIAYLTAAKERIRWLSRKFEITLAKLNAKSTHWVIQVHSDDPSTEQMTVCLGIREYVISEHFASTAVLLQTSVDEEFIRFKRQQDAEAYIRLYTKHTPDVSGINATFTAVEMIDD